MDDINPSAADSSTEQPLQFSTNASAKPATEVPSPGTEPAEIHEVDSVPTGTMEICRDVDEMYPDSEKDEEAEAEAHYNLSLEEEMSKAEEADYEEEPEALNRHHLSLEEEMSKAGKGDHQDETEASNYDTLGMEEEMSKAEEADHEEEPEALARPPLSLEEEMSKAGGGDHQDETEASNRHGWSLKEEKLMADNGDDQEARAEATAGEVTRGSHTSMEKDVGGNGALADTTDEQQHTTAPRVGTTNGHGERVYGPSAALAVVKIWLAPHWLLCAIFVPVCLFAALYVSSSLCRPIYDHSPSNGRIALEGARFCGYIEWASPFGSKATHHGETIDPVQRLPAPVFPDDPAAHMTSLRSILSLLPRSHISARLEYDLGRRLRAAEAAIAQGDVKLIAPPSTTAATIPTTSCSSSCDQTIYTLPLDIAVLTSPSSCTVGMAICAVRELYISNEALTQAFSDLQEVEDRFAGQAEVSQWVKKWNASVRGALRGLVAKRYR